MKKLILVSLIVTQIGFAATPCEAGLLDWLFHRRSCCRPVPAYPVTTAQSPCCGTQVLQRVVVNYAPQTTFQTRWEQVPVTYYRPLTGVDPNSCCPTTTLQPCTAMQWRARRVPVTCYRPIYSTVAVNALSPVTALAAPQASCAGCSPAASGYGAGQYAVPSTQVLPATPGAWGPRQFSDPTPAELHPSDAGQEPADIRPSLDDSGFNRPDLGTTSRLSPPTLGARSSVILRGPEGPDVRTSLPVERNTNLRPIPDPDRDTGTPDGGSSLVPQLLNPDDKTARRAVRHASYSTISWPERHTVVRPVEVRPAAPRREIEPARTWDESGWQAPTRRSGR